MNRSTLVLIAGLMTVASALVTATVAIRTHRLARQAPS